MDVPGIKPKMRKPRKKVKEVPIFRIERGQFTIVFNSAPKVENAKDTDSSKP